MADYDYDYTDDYFDLEDEDDYGLGSLWNDDYDGYGQDYENDEFAEDGDEATYANESYDSHISSAYHDSDQYDYSSQDTPDSYDSNYLSGAYLGDANYYSHEKHLTHASSVREYQPRSYSNDMGPDGYAVDANYLGDDAGYNYGGQRYYARQATRSMMHHPGEYSDSPLQHHPYPYPDISHLRTPIARSATHLAQHHTNSDYHAGTGVYPPPPFGRPRSISHNTKPLLPPINTVPQQAFSPPIRNAPRRPLVRPIDTAPQAAYLTSSQGHPPLQPRSADPVPAASENFQGDGPASLAVPTDRRDSSVRRTKSLSKPLSSIANNAMSVPRRGLSKLKSGFRGRTLTRHGFRDKSRSRSGSPVRG